MDLDPATRRMADASWRALNTPDGDAILERMLSGATTIEDGLVALLELSGEYERIDPPPDPGKSFG